MKNLKYLLMAMFAMVIAMSFTACGDDDDDQGQETAKKSEFSYSFTFSEDVLTLANVTAYYIDATGAESSEAITSTTWQKTFTASKFDVSTGVKITVVAKDGVTLSKEKYDLKMVPSILVSTSNGGHYLSNAGSVNSTGTQAEYVLSMLSKLEGTYAYKVDANGEISETTLSWKN